MTNDPNTLNLSSDPQKLYHAVVAAVSVLPAEEQLRVKESLAAKFGREVNDAKGGMYGSQLHNALDAQDKKTLDVSPYSHMGAGSLDVVTARDEDTGKVYVLLGRNWKDPKDHSKGVEADLRLPGGYVMAAPLEGGDKSKYYDKDLADTARRELAEETGIKVQTNDKLVSLGADSRLGVSNTEKLHTVTEFYHFAISTKDPRFQLQKQASDDFAAMQWVDADKIILNPLVTPQGHGSNISRYTVITDDGKSLPLRDLHGDYIQKAVIAEQQSMKTTRQIDAAAANDASVSATPSSVVTSVAFVQSLMHSVQHAFSR